MAKKTLIVDDLTGEVGARPRTLRFDGVEYEIDLTDASFADLRHVLRPYLRAARVVGKGADERAGAGSGSHSGRRTRRASSASASDAAVIRAWARSAGLAVTSRGRVHPDLRAAWIAAGSPTDGTTGDAPAS